MSTTAVDYMPDLWRVGAEKPMGYLPIQTIENCGWSVWDARDRVLEKGLKARVMGEAECQVGSGALYCWDEEAVQNLIDRNLAMLILAGWPIKAADFVQKVWSEFAEDPKVYELVGVMFADPRMAETKFVRRP